MPESQGQLSQARRAAHRPSRRDEILGAGAAEFAERGFAPVSVMDIARRAGMTPAAVYYHFQAKEELLAELLVRTGEGILELLCDIDPSGPGSDQIEVLVDAFLDWLARHPVDGRLYYLSSEGATAEAETLRRKQRRDQVAALREGPLRRLQPGMSSTEQKVVALALLVLFGEVTRILTHDGQGARNDRAAVRRHAVDLARRIVT